MALTRAQKTRTFWDQPVSLTRRFGLIFPERHFHYLGWIQRP